MQGETANGSIQLTYNTQVMLRQFLGLILGTEYFHVRALPNQTNPITPNKL